MEVRLCINERAALENLRYAFTERYTLLRELLQNARRAKATRVTVTYDATRQHLTVVDDGVGIADFQQLFTLHQSGWDEATIRDEHPFGVGFAQCLYSATRCIVESRGNRIDFLAEQALAQQPILIQPGAVRTGTCVQLFDIDLPNLEYCLADLVGGFPLQVTYNGVVMERLDSLDSRAFIPSPIGWVYLAGRDDGQAARKFVAYLQGMRILAPLCYRSGERMNVLHLDPRRFMARLPDRDRLIDEEAQRQLISTTLGILWRTILLESKARLAPTDFLDRYANAALMWEHADLFDDLPLLPGYACDQIVGYPYQEGGMPAEYRASVWRQISQADVTTGAVQIARLAPLDATNAARWMYARARGCLLLQQPLRPSHWLTPQVCALDEAPLGVDIVGEHCRTEFCGQRIACTVVLCDRYAITVGNDRVEVADAGLFHEQCLIIPNSELSGRVCRQASSYCDDDDRFQDAEFQWDLTALTALIRRLRSGDPRSALTSLLGDLHLEQYPLLHGRTFRLQVGATGDTHRVDLVG